jgi:hypothetical protein
MQYLTLIVRCGILLVRPPYHLVSYQAANILRVQASGSIDPC